MRGVACRSLVALTASPVFLWCAGEGKVDGTWWRSSGLAVLASAVLCGRSSGRFECSADVVAESGVCHDGEALARVEGEGRHCGCVELVTVRSGWNFVVGLFGIGIDYDVRCVTGSR